MRIKKLTNSNVLKPGQLLVVLHCLNQCGFRRPRRFAKKHRSRSRSILSASPGAGSMDWPVGQWQIVPAPENNE
jgi:hypothetical protein